MDSNKQAQPIQAEVSVQRNIQQSVSPTSPSGSKFRLTILIAILLIAVGAGAYFWVTRPGSFFSQVSQNQQKLAELRREAKDLSIASDMRLSRINAELIYGDNGSYGGIACSNTQFNSLCDGIKKLSGEEPVFYSNDSTYCGYAKLSNGKYYCIDNNSHSGKTNVNPSGANYCNGNTYVCPPASSVVDSESSSQNQTDPTANWKRYANSIFNFQIKYPPNYKISNDRGSDVAKSLQSDYSYIDFSNLTKPTLENTKQININGFQGYERPLGGGNMDGGIEFEVLFQNASIRNVSKSNYLDILFTTNQKGYENKIEEFRKILSTFKFTDVNNPRITVTSPNEGENWATGETHVISWTASNVKNVIISLLQGNSRSYLISSKTGVDASLQKFDWTINDSAFYVGRNDLRIILSDAAYCNYVDESTGIECVKDEIKHGDESDNYFSIVSANLSLPTVCEDKPEGMPVITSLSNYSGSIGAKVEIMGCNFSGFEGDKSAWIENGQGIKGIIYGEEGSTSKSLKVTLKSPLCQKDNSNSGLSCDAWLTLNPGTYKIYTLPWGKKSNEASFTIK